MTEIRTPKQIFEGLSTAQRRFLLEKDATGERTAEEWLQFLKPIVAFDILIDSSTKRLQQALRLLSFMAVFNLLVAIVISNGWVAAAGLVMGLLAVYQWIRRSGNAKRDLDNHLREHFVPLLIALTKKGQGQVPVQAKFQLREKDKSTRVIEAYFETRSGPISLFMARGEYELHFMEENIHASLKNRSELTQEVIRLLTGNRSGE